MNGLEPAFILHSYPFQDHGLLLKLFTPQSGFYTAVAKGAKQIRSPWYGLLQPFTPLLIKCRGKGEVLSLQKAERAGKSFSYQQKNLLSGFYLNELLMAFLQPNHDYTNLFSAYYESLERLTGDNIEAVLRDFELRLLQDLGIAPEFSSDINHAALIENEAYLLLPGSLPQKVSNSHAGLVLNGEELLAIQRREWHNSQTLRNAKKVLRAWISYYSRGKVFKSRELYKVER